MKIPLLVEVIGEPAVGKTHFSLTFPQPFLIDTTPKAEAMVIVMKLHKDWKKRYVNATRYEELVSAVEEAVRREDVKTVIIDTGADLQAIAAKHYLEMKKRQGLMPVEYGRVRDMVDQQIIRRVIESEKNLVVTAQVKDEYIDGQKTGRKIRDGYPRLPHMADIELQIILDKEASPPKRRIMVLKNRFMDATDPNYISELEPQNAEGVKQLVIKSLGWSEAEANEYLIW